MKIIGFSFFAVFFIALLTRLFILSSVPTGITGDELDYILNAKSVYLTGSDMSGTWSPFSLKPPPFEEPKAELPYLIMAPFIGISPLSLFFGRLPYIFLNVLLIGTIYLICQRLFNKQVALIAGLLMIINPWSFYFGRTTYDTMIAITFYFISLYVILVTKKWYILLTFPFLFVAFYSYIGTKLILIPFVLITIFYSWFIINKRKYTKQYLLLLLLCFLTIGFFIISFTTNPVSSRAGNIFLPTNPAISSDVNMYRKLSIESPLTPLFINKYTVYIKQIIDLYLGSFNPNLLFINGENTPFMSIRNHGFFFLVDILFLVIGFVSLFKDKFKTWLFVVSLILIAPLPAALSIVGTSYGIRASLVYPLLIIFIGYGIFYSINFVKNKKLKLITIGTILILYIFSFFNYLFIYIINFPMVSSEQQGFSERILVKYLDLNKANNIIVIEKTTGKIPSLYKQYLFYTNSLTSQNTNLIKNSIQNNSYVINNISFTECLSDTKSYIGSIVIVNEGSKCKIPNKNIISITRLSDGGSVYKIIGDTMCNQYNLAPYIRSISFEELNVEDMSEQKFCETYISNH